MVLATINKDKDRDDYFYHHCIVSMTQKVFQFMGVVIKKWQDHVACVMIVKFL